MYSEEETELRDLIIQNLESCGFLSKIKAELRAGVCLALEEDGNLKNKIPIFNKKFDDFVGTGGGKLLFSLVREFLEYFNLKFTLSVFDPETATTSPCISRTELCKQLNLNCDIDGPVLSALVEQKFETDQNENSIANPPEQFLPVANKSLKSILIENTAEQNIKDLPNENNVLYNKSIDDSSLIKEKKYVAKSIDDDAKDTLSSTVVLPKTDSNVLTNTSAETGIADITPKSSSKIKDILKETEDVLSSEHDSFFDEPVPAEKTSFFSFAETFKDKSESKLASGTKNDLDEFKKNSLSSLRDLPSLTTNSEWTFSRDTKNTLPSLESQKSVSSSETSNEEIINLESKEDFPKKESVVESNEESSEKQISEESIEEELDDDFSAGFDDLLNSSLSIADDATTDQTVSQISTVEGVDHVEPCK